MVRYIKCDNSFRTISSVEELIEELDSGNYNYYGLRGAYDSDMNNLGRGYLDCSSVWDDGNYSDEKLPGTSALAVTEYMGEDQLMSIYTRAKTMYSPIGKVLLIADKNQEYGVDDGEVMLGTDGYGADVVAIVDL